MATPAEHKTSAETVLTRLDANPMIATDVDRKTAQVHAVLAQATGTGTHYAAAEAALTDAASSSASGGYHAAATTLERGLAHALLADRT